MKKPAASSTTRGDRATRYAQDVVAGKIVAGPWVRLACKRHLDDLVDGHRRGLKWDLEKARRAIAFFEDFLVLAEGQHAGRPFKLRPWQAFIIGSVFGWLAADGFRRFGTVFCEVAKGNGKTPLAAGVALYLLMADDEPAAEVYSAATMRDQAKLAWTDALRMVAASPELRGRLLVNAHAIQHRKSGSSYKAVSSEARGLDGKRVHGAMIDELQEHPNALVVDKMRDGTKGRRQALIFEITNSGFDQKSVAGQHHDRSCKIVAGTLADDGWFAYVAGVDEGEEPLDDESCWPKANPNLGVSVTRKYLRKQVKEAKQLPARESDVRRVNFCQWVGAASPIFRKVDWDACQFDVDLGALERDVACSLGLDLSGKKDLTACALCFDVRKLDGDRLAAALGMRGVALMHRPEFVEVVIFWTPADTAADRERKDGAPYTLWIDQGELLATPGAAVDYAFVAHQLGELKARFQVGRVAFDPYHMAYLEQDLSAQGVELDLVQHGQGYYRSQQSSLWMPRSVELLEVGVAERRIAFRRSPVLTWNAASAVLVTDPTGNRKFNKAKATGKIDGIVAAAMARGAAEVPDDGSIDDWLRNPLKVI